MDLRLTTTLWRSLTLGFGCLVLLAASAAAQPRFQWVKTAVGPSFVELTSADIGPDGNLHIAGTFDDSVSFDGEGFSSYGNYDNFSARYSATGKVVDFDGYGGLDADDARSIAVDKNGNVYVAGSFFDQCVVGGTVIEAIELFGGDMYLAKFDKVGILQWVKVFGSPTYDEVAPYIAVDSLGAVYLAGGFGGTAQFGTRSVTTMGKSDIFVAKISAMGDVTWVKSAGSLENDQAIGICVSPNGDRIYTVGTFKGSVNFEISSLTSQSNSQDLFIWAHGANGQPLWVRQIGNRNDDRFINCTTDKDGKLVVTGALSGTTTFHDRQITANSDLYSDIFLSRFDKAGTIEFAKNYGGAYEDVGLDVAVDSRGSIFVAGYFDSTSVFGGTYVQTEGGKDALILRAFSNGEIEWARSAGGPFDDEGRAVMVSRDGVPYLAGIYDTEAIFGDIRIVEGRFSDGFLAALECGPNTSLSTPGPEITICEGQDSILSTRAGYPEYAWFVNGTSASTTFRLGLSPLPQGTHTVYVRVTDFYGCSLNSDTLTITVTEGLPEPVITRDGDSLRCSITEGVTYEWFHEGVRVEGAEGPSVAVQGDGLYRVRIKNDMGCDRSSDDFLIGVTSVEEGEWGMGNRESITVYPNPFVNQLTVRCPIGAEISITDVTGRTVARATALNELTDLTIDGASGVYVVAVRTEAGTQTILSLKR